MRTTLLLFVSIIISVLQGCDNNRSENGGVKAPIPESKGVVSISVAPKADKVKQESAPEQKPKTPKDTDYKVQTFNGVPFITEDGKPVRGRVFWGAYGGTIRPKIDNTKWTEISFEFVPEHDYPKTNLQVRSGEAAGKFYIADFYVKNLTTGKTLKSVDFSGPERDKNLMFWCAGMNENPPLKMGNVKIDGAENGALCVNILERNTKVGGLHLYLPGIALKKGEKYKFHLRAKANSTRNMSLSLYNVEKGFNLIASNGEKTFVPQIVCAKDGGVDYVSFGISAVWTPPDAKPDYSYIDKIFKDILAANPNAKLWPRVGVDAPSWWIRTNRDHVMKNSDGTLNNRYASISSRKYRQDANKALRLFIEYCEKNYPNNMSGYMPTGANTGEWFYGGTWLRPYSGYDKATLEAWRNWLSEKYESSTALQAAWGDGDITFADANIPSEIEREGDGSYLIDLSKRQNVADFNEFLQDEMVGLLASFGDTIRKSAPRRLSIFFYAYGFEFSGVRNGPAFSGHFGLEKLLKLPQIDIICGPISYHDRKFGDAKTVMGAAESVAEAGKIWLDEDDTSTYLDVKIPGRCPATDLLTDTRQKTIKVLRRNLAQEALRNQASWWMDLFGDGWFYDPELWKQMKLFEKPELDMISHPVKYAPEVAAVIDERSMCTVWGMQTSYATSGKLIHGARINLNRCGAPFGHYLLSDVLSGKTSAKLNVFLSAYALDSKQRKSMAATAKNSACIFALAPGIVDVDNRKFSLKAVEEATGFGVKYAGNVEAKAFATEAGLKAGAVPKSFGTSAKVKPLLSPVPKDSDEILAKFSDGSPAVVLRKSGKHPQLFCAVPEIPRSLYKYMMKLAEVHIYTNDEAAVYANGNYISVTALKDGPVKLDIPSSEKIYDAVEDKLLGTAPALELDMKKGDIYLLRLGGGNASLKK